MDGEWRKVKLKLPRDFPFWRLAEPAFMKGGIFPFWRLSELANTPQEHHQRARTGTHARRFPARMQMPNIAT